MFKIDFFAKGFLALGVCLALTPAVFAVAPFIESQAFPVVRDTQVSRVDATPHGTSFYIQFRKVRRCEYLGLVWYEGPNRLYVEIEPGAEDHLRPRPTGDQFAGPWLVRDLSDLAESRSYLYHRCHPLWTTITRFYYGRNAKPGADNAS